MENENRNNLARAPGAFALALRKYRKAAGYSQKEVAAILCMNRSTYTYYETGKTAPDPDTLYRISKIFGVTMEAFFEDEKPVLKLSDSGAPRPRAYRLQRPDPKHVGDLTTEERQIIAYMRDKNLAATAVLRALRKRFDSVP